MKDIPVSRVSGKNLLFAGQLVNECHLYSIFWHGSNTFRLPTHFPVASCFEVWLSLPFPSTGSSIRLMLPPIRLSFGSSATTSILSAPSLGAALRNAGLARSTSTAKPSARVHCLSLALARGLLPPSKASRTTALIHSKKRGWSTTCHNVATAKRGRS